MNNISNINNSPNIFIINDINNILTKKVTHYSLDKGLFIGHGLTINNCSVYFLTTGKSEKYNGINFINIKHANLDFLKTIDLIIIIREGLIPELFEEYDILRKYIVSESRKSKIMVKSDSIQWIISKHFRKYLANKNYIKSPKINHCVNWVNKYFDYVCIQTKEFREEALKINIHENKLIQLNMAISHIMVDVNNLENPYFNNNNYCQNLKTADSGKALIPNYFIENNVKFDRNIMKDKKIIIYTGRIKTDKGRILFFMKDIMNYLDDNYELHIFPGSFIIPDIDNSSYMNCSSNNYNHIMLLKNKIFNDCKNIYVHFPYEHKNMIPYLHFAYCGIDFSDVRPRDSVSKAGHAKILEYCSVGLPIVCEENINNLFLIERGKNGIVLPYLATAEQYARAIEKIGNLNIDRNYCIKETYKYENCIVRTRELLDNISIN